MLGKISYDRKNHGVTFFRENDLKPFPDLLFTIPLGIEDFMLGAITAYAWNQLKQFSLEVVSWGGSKSEFFLYGHNDGQNAPKITM